MVMIRVNVHEVKAKLSEYLDRATRGERIIICRHNTPVAELRPVTEGRTEPRPIGPLVGRPSFDVADAFFEPLSEAELAEWEAVAPSDVPGVEALTPPRTLSRASEGQVTYKPTRPRTWKRKRT